jgi:hypothetical protein
MRPSVRIEVNPWYPVNEEKRQFEFLAYLRHVNEVSVVENEDVPPLCIIANGRVLGIVDPYDHWELGDEGFIVERIRELKPAVIFKYQLRRGILYPPGTISAGYPCLMQVPCPANLMTRPRPTDVTARMRVNHDYHWGADKQWMLDRSRIVEEARILGREGYESKSGRIPRDQYVAELWDTQVGFDWRGVGYLTRRIIEYIRAGVVPITRPFGDEWPLREDVILEDGIHCIFCPEPGQFASEARSLLADRAKIKRIRSNLVELWRQKLCPVAQGYWIWEKLKASLVCESVVR